VAETELNLSLQALTGCITRITKMHSPSLKELAGKVVRDLNGVLRMPDRDEPAAALLRFFMTRPYKNLEPEARRFIAENFPELEPTPNLKCLTLMGTVGDEDAWCSIEGSRGHQAIPLVSEEMVQGIPMIARMVSQLGLKITDVLEPDVQLADELDRRAFDVFHVENALGSAFIPAQEEFVEKHGIKSVVGFGSMLPTGHLCSVIVFSKAKITKEVAGLFRPLALGVRIAVLPLLEKRILSGQGDAFNELDNVRAQHAAQEQLLSVFHETVIEQSDKLDGTLEALQSANQDIQTTLDSLRDTQARLASFEAKLVSRYAVEKLKDPATYRLAFVVGTLINAYGHIVVPALRGHPDVWGNFLTEFSDSPVLASFSILLAYLFPIAVQIHSAVRTRMRGHASELRATFPDSKPDPVFRAAPDGKIIDAGETTRTILNKHKLEQAQDVLGDELFAQIIKLQEKGARLPRETAIKIAPLQASYLVVHSPASDGAVNIYLTEVDPR
jgi:hypothetical protein